MQGKIISSTKELLQACANGGEPRRTYDHTLGKDVWHLHTRRLNPVRILRQRRPLRRKERLHRTHRPIWQLTPPCALVSPKEHITP